MKRSQKFVFALLRSNCTTPTGAPTEKKISFVHFLLSFCGVSQKEIHFDMHTLISTRIFIAFLVTIALFSYLEARFESTEKRRKSVSVQTQMSNCLFLLQRKFSDLRWEIIFLSLLIGTSLATNFVDATRQLSFFIRLPLMRPPTPHALSARTRHCLPPPSDSEAQFSPKIFEDLPSFSFLDTHSEFSTENFFTPEIRHRLRFDTH